MSYKKKQKKTLKNKKVYSKRKRGGSCSCNAKLFQKMNGGGDFFNGGNLEPASFKNVPIHSFYPQNNYIEGSDIQRGQLASRNDIQVPTTTNSMKGGRKCKSTLKMRRMSLKYKKGKKSIYDKNFEKRHNRGGTGAGAGDIPYRIINAFADPLITTNKYIINSLGNTSNSLMSSNILKGKFY